MTIPTLSYAMVTFAIFKFGPNDLCFGEIYICLLKPWISIICFSIALTHSLTTCATPRFDRNTSFNISFIHLCVRWTNNSTDSYRQHEFETSKQKGLEFWHKFTSLHWNNEQKGRDWTLLGILYPDRHGLYVLGILLLIATTVVSIWYKRLYRFLFISWQIFLWTTFGRRCVFGGSLFCDVCPFWRSLFCSNVFLLTFAFFRYNDSLKQVFCRFISLVLYFWCWNCLIYGSTVLFRDQWNWWRWGSLFYSSNKWEN